MTVFLPGGARRGALAAVPSKSAAHRLFILAAFGAAPCEIACDPLSADLEATLGCLGAFGASVSHTDGRVRIEPMRAVPAGERLLPCGESGTTLRFFLPLAGVWGLNAVFALRGRLGERPLEPFVSELKRHGMTIGDDGGVLRCAGRLRGGSWTLPGDVSSQFISALLLALPLLEEDSTLTLTPPLESVPYITLTEETLRAASIRFVRDGTLYAIPGRQRPSLPSSLAVEGDFSAAANFLAMGALSEAGVSLSGLKPDSVQGDRAIVGLLRDFGAEVSVGDERVTVRKKTLHGIRFDAAQTPDLAPVIAALGALAEGETRIENASRLRGKESDRLHTTAAMLRSLGADVTELADGLAVRGKAFRPGGVTEGFSDHRIAMAAAVAACGCENGVTLRGAECVNKSDPRFWDDFTSLEV